MKKFALLLAVSAALGTAPAAFAGVDCCEPAPVCCEPAPVCPAPPVSVTFCAVDPCDCCQYSITVCLPAECACQTPCLVTWKKGVFGRKILTYKFPCGECVEVVITKHGKAFAR